jgi:hypothetical protein
METRNYFIEAFNLSDFLTEQEEKDIAIKEIQENFDTLFNSIFNK